MQIGKMGQIMDHKSILSDYVISKDLRLIDKFNLSGSCSPTEGFPVIKLHNDDKPTFHPFHIIINKLMGENQMDTMGNSCDEIFSMFLYSVSKIVNLKFYMILGIFFRSVRECLNENGFDVIEKYLKDKYGDEAIGMIHDKNGQIFCVDRNVEYVPLIADKFILEYLPKNRQEFNQQLALDLMYDFCNWLVKKKLTKIKISFSDANTAFKGHNDKKIA